MLDLAIIGGGPAGLTAGMYAIRGGLKNVDMFEKGMLGGQITQSSEIENYPGSPKIQTGMDFMDKWPEQAMRFGLKHEMVEILRVQKKGETFEILMHDGKVVEAKAVIVCTGSNPKKAGFEGEKEFFGKGVSTCATCDGFFYKNKEVAVLGGGDTALEEALHLAHICSKVYLIHRREEFRASPTTVKRVKETANIELVLNSSVQKVYGSIMGVDGVMLENSNGEIRDLKVPGIFTFVGMHVNNGILKQENGEFLCDVTKGGEIVVNLSMQTSVKGLYAAGDIRLDAPKQVVCAASDGAIAAINVLNYLNM